MIFSLEEGDFMLKIIDPDVLIVSETDLDGHITYANQEFSDACEFDVELMMGFRHNLIRAPDMPDWVFERMWSDIVNNKVWTGVVKNNTFNGDKVYWVKAVIVPKFNEKNEKIGYRSERRQATNEEISAAMKLYGVDID